MTPHTLAAPVASLAVLLLGLDFAERAHAQSTQADGPTDQGECVSTSPTTFSCINGAICTWAGVALGYSCEGGGGALAESSGPPGMNCTLEADDIWECEEDLSCQLDESVWICRDSTPASSANSCDGIDLGYYDEALHIVGLFVVLVASVVGVCFPLVAFRWLSRSLSSSIFFAAKHFGTGVIISTAFVHLLYETFVAFANPCLGQLEFSPTAAAISMSGVYLVFIVDFFIMRWLKSRTLNRATSQAVALADSPSSSITPVSDKAKLSKSLGHSHGPAVDEETDFTSQQARFDIYLLEGGICFHSVTVGVALGASGGSQYTAILVAICFHQMFEGLALGSRIGLLVWPAGDGWKKWAMAAGFSITTPLGIGIGIGVHHSYNPNSLAALISIGVLDGVSAGILLYAGLVELLYHDFMHGELVTASKKRATLALLFLFAGSACMAVVGKWA